MFRISDTLMQDSAMLLSVTGNLAEDDLAYFQNHLNFYLNQGRRVRLDLDGCIHISLQCRRYLKGIRDSVDFVTLPDYLRGDIMA